MAQKKRTTTAGQVVTLADLAPRHDVTGGSQKRVFGSDPIGPSVDKERPDMTANKNAKKAKDLPAKSPSGVKGGAKVDRLAANDNMTLMRAAKPKKVKDLPAKSSSGVKGGAKMERLSANDNVTLVRAIQ